MIISAIPGVAAAAAAYSEVNSRMENVKAQISALKSTQSSLTSTVSTLSTSSTCILSKVRYTLQHSLCYSKVNYSHTAFRLKKLQLSAELL